MNTRRLTVFVGDFTADIVVSGLASLEMDRSSVLGLGIPQYLWFGSIFQSINTLMKYSEISTDRWMQAKISLDKLFALGSGNDSSMKRIRQGFDQKTGEHVINQQYRAKARNQNMIAQNQQKPRTDTKGDEAKKKKS
jgi:hypothetical protein